MYSFEELFMKEIDDVFLDKISGGNSGLAAAGSGLTNQSGGSIAQGVVSGRHTQGNNAGSSSSGGGSRGGGRQSGDNH
jgi:hypothetical protein